MAVRAAFSNRPQFLELIAVRIVVAPAALLEPGHLADFRPVAGFARHAHVFSREGEARLLMVESPEFRLAGVRSGAHFPSERVVAPFALGTE